MPSDSDFTAPPIAAHAASDDRRTDKRFTIARPGKVFRRTTQQYAPATTRNLSLTGALLAVEAQRPFAVGELIDIGLSYGRHQVVPTDKLIRGMVVRVEQADAGRQNIGVRYVEPIAPAMAA